ncbi:MAG: NIF family HAD-type phosphatase [Bdellovibrionales bacterium]|jgi:hypothetical protein|nr:NIF family HAD-type phosphatase [Bdellovibrionales bacterium]
MKRPYLVHFLSIFTDEFISIKAYSGIKDNNLGPSGEFRPSFPLQNFYLLRSHHFNCKFVGIDQSGREIYTKFVESDNFGNFNFKVPLTETTKDISKWQIYETSYYPGVELHLGCFIPMILESPKKYVICDFDKTLVDTRYSTTKELYHSLTSPIESYPTVIPGVNLFKSFIEKDYSPFIVSASPHFYENAIKDWLYKNGIYTAGILLKDYRHAFHPFSGELTPKDIKVHGLYKLNHLLNIILLGGFPSEVIMIGDSHESDPTIYLIFAKLLKGSHDPWAVWNSIKQFPIFNSSKAQSSKILNKFYQLKNLKLRHKEDHSIKIKIYIRKIRENEKIKIPTALEKDAKDIIFFS